MSFGKALYFPFIQFQDENWLKHSLLYRDGIKRIVLTYFPLEDSGSVQILAMNGLVESIDPAAEPAQYTKGAAKEFLPTLQSLKASRNCHLGRWKSIADAATKNAGNALIHCRKMDESVAAMLKRLGTGQTIGQKQSAPLLSAAGSYFQHASDLDQQVPHPDREFRLARIVLPVPQFVNFSQLSAEDFMGFQKKRRPVRLQFRQVIEAAVEEGAGVIDPEALKDFLHQEKGRIEAAVEDQRKVMSELRIDMVNSVMAISIPSFVGAGFAAVGANPLVAVKGTGFSLAASAISLFSKIRGERRKAVRQCDWHYLLTVEKNSGSGKWRTKPRTRWSSLFVIESSTNQKHDGSR